MFKSQTDEMGSLRIRISQMEMITGVCNRVGDLLVIGYEQVGCFPSPKDEFKILIMG